MYNIDIFTVQWEHHTNTHIVMINNKHNKVMGSCNIVVSDNICELKSLYLKPGYRKNGLGKVLVDEAIIHFKTLKYRELFIEVNKSHTNLIKWYEGLGFEFYPNHGDVNDEDEFVWMFNDILTS
jgi:putative acetyltransferase